MKSKSKNTLKQALNEADKNFIINLLQEENLLLKEKIQRLEKRLKDVEAKSNKDSRNSNKPPSSDMHKRNKSKDKNKTSSLKKKSGKRPGGQPGHKGTTLPMCHNPDEIIRYEVHTCGHCHNDLRNKPATLDIRQEYEIPKPRMFVREHQGESVYCEACEYTTKAEFPEHITHKTQYGPIAKSMMVYLTQHQYLPYDRASQLFEAVYHHKVSPGTLVNTVSHLGRRLTDLDAEIKEYLAKSDLAHADETSININGSKRWLHTVGTDVVAHFGMHVNRGKKATQEIGILPSFTGILVHDHWKSYFTYENILHVLCNAHHLRELKFFDEQHSMKWANKMYCLLNKINNHKQELIKKSKFSFCRRMIKKYETEYDDILKSAQREQAKRGTIDSHNLMHRLKDFKEATLLFMYDFSVPFTNNLSEQDLRMHKIKQKISGCFRSEWIAEQYCKIRSMLVSGRKNRHNPFELIQRAFTRKLSLKYILAT